MRALTCYIAAGVLVAAASMSARAETLAYGEAFDTLYRIDLAQPAASKLGVAGRYAGQSIANVSGLTTMPDGSLLAIAGSIKALVRIDPATGQATPIGPLGIDGGSGQFDALDLGMTATCTGGLYLSSGVLQSLYSVNPGTGAATRIGATGVAISGLAERGGVLFGAGAKGDHHLYRINPRTGATSTVGAFGPAASKWINSAALSFDDDGTLWAVLNYVPPQNENTPPPDWSDLAQINPATGELEMVGPITGPVDSLRQIGMKGFTIGPTSCARPSAAPNPAPVDSWWALSLLGLGLAGLVARTRRIRAA